MKQSLLIVGLMTLLASCNGLAGWFDKKEETSNNLDSVNRAVPTVLVRDVSITTDNAYSDLFLDSIDVENFIQENNIPGALEQNLRNFYNARNYQYAWFAKDGVTEQGISFWNLYQQESKDSTEKKNRSLQNRMDTVLENDSLIITDTSFKKTELQLTQQFIQYAEQHLLEDENLEMVYYMVPAKKQNSVQLVDSILHKQKNSAQHRSNIIYTGLKQHLATYYKAAQKGGWQPITSATYLRKGVNGPAVTALKKRLQLTGDYNSSDTTNSFNDSLELAIKDLQLRNGLAASGAVSDSLLTILNIPVDKRIEQLIINMNRSLWLPAKTDSNQIQVNIPSFMLYAYEGHTKVFEMPVVVGKEGASTLMFTGTLNQIVFSPYWNIPESIVREEIMPAMKQDATYLKKNNMEVVGSKDSIPRIRQLPGGNNSLGKVKFLFPNSYDIYLHDTPAKELFAQKNRALSHGCIRLADAAKLAQYLLREQQDWTPEKINTAMNNNKEQFVALKNDVPVFINYYTAWVDENGKLNFTHDPYRHDLKTAAKLFGGTTTVQNTTPMTPDSTNKII